MREPAVLYEDNHLLVLAKPAGMPSQGDPSGDLSLLDWGKAYLARAYDKPGNVFLGLVHRLDRPVGGVMVFARTSKAASRLSEAFRGRRVTKIYRALLEMAPDPASGTLEHWLRPAAGMRPTEASVQETSGTQHARLRYRTLEKTAAGVEVEIELETGRKHQIRAQFAAIGCPILGDRRYGAKRTWRERDIALHASSLALPHPTTGETLTFVSPPPWSATPNR